MDLKWFAGLSDQERKELKQQLIESRNVLERLDKILNKALKDSVEEMSKKDKFFMPAWSEYTAHALGEQEALRTVIKLLKGNTDV